MRRNACSTGPFSSPNRTLFRFGRQMIGMGHRHKLLGTARSNIYAERQAPTLPLPKNIPEEIDVKRTAEFSFPSL
jgi:hypothetical protein